MDFSKKGNGYESETVLKQGVVVFYRINPVINPLTGKRTEWVVFQLRRSDYQALEQAKEVGRAYRLSAAKQHAVVAYGDA